MHAPEIEQTFRPRRKWFVKVFQMSSHGVDENFFHKHAVDVFVIVAMVWRR